MKLIDLENKRILILGLGEEGMDTFSFLRQVYPVKILGLADKKEMAEFSLEVQKKIKGKENLGSSCLPAVRYLGKDYLQSLAEYDVIFKTPGIPLSEISPYLKKNHIITSQAGFFLENCPGKIIGITGTKGKGTTASLLHEILKTAGLKSFLVGNIGEPVLSYLKSAKKDDIFVYELSSHQLQNLKISPHTAGFLNLYQAHLDHFKDIKEYQESKESITLFQNKKDWFIYNQDQKELRHLAKKTKAQKICISLESRKADCFFQDGWLFWQRKKIIQAKEIPLIGRFNLYNVMMAISAAKLLKIKNETIREAIKEFRALPHRLEFVGDFNGIGFYNDSLATLPEPVIFAIDAFGDRIQTIILGGHDAGQNFESLAKKILESKIKNIIFFLPTGKRIHRAILKIGESEPKFKKRAQGINYFFADNMEKAINIVFENTSQGKVCLLSPACPSFGVFKNYKDRGEQFKKYIQEYGKKNRS